ncbi:hypothetical protein SmJEL517_g04701 [Synchytrium microbalum]|uniref:Protein kinase domain-containing protein n=1 Tax=Synchytrium microbalum TaxID=1806994 RepID=A0A507BQU4_9FUNG|nr:uncharacterized protein SmJEL517_g04701 [Synchytrium microbalum]TPX32130.1 hypothetical protein SmJEL517_g04701 [Synchytrium microbalum]
MDLNYPNRPPPPIPRVAEKMALMKPRCVDEGYTSLASMRVSQVKPSTHTLLNQSSLETVIATSPPHDEANIKTRCSSSTVSKTIDDLYQSNYNDDNVVSPDLQKRRTVYIDSQNATFVENRGGLSDAIAAEERIENDLSLYREASAGSLGSESDLSESRLPPSMSLPDTPTVTHLSRWPPVQNLASVAADSNTNSEEDLSSMIQDVDDMVISTLSQDSSAKTTVVTAEPTSAPKAPRKALGWSARLSSLAAPLHLVNSLRQQLQGYSHHQQPQAPTSAGTPATSAHQQQVQPVSSSFSSLPPPPPYTSSTSISNLLPPQTVKESTTSNSKAVTAQTPATAATTTQFRSSPLLRRFIHGNKVVPSIADKFRQHDEDSKIIASAEISHDEKEKAPSIDQDDDADDDYGTPKSRNAKRFKCPAFDLKYKTLKKLGSGGHSTVRLAQTIADPSKRVVCKFIRSSSVWHWHRPSPARPKVPLEIHLMRQLAIQQPPHPAIVKYIEHFEYNTRYIIVMEYLGEDWVDLYDYVEVHGPVREDHSREIFTQIVDAIEFLHKLGYSHNDVKDENIMINTKTREVKIIDFGSATPLIPGQTASLFFGTKKFAAPEAVQGLPYYPEAQEVWALGALLYVLLFKMDPFRGDREIVELDISRRIERLRQMGKRDGGADISDAAATACRVMLEKDWSRRIRVKDIKKLAFFRPSSRKHVPKLSSFAEGEDDEEEEWV